MTKEEMMEKEEKACPCGSSMSSADRKVNEVSDDNLASVSGGVIVDNKKKKKDNSSAVIFN